MPRKEYWKKRQNYHNLKQRFDLVKTLGQGTYGKVKLAVDRTSGIQFAIKTIKKLKIGNVHDMTRIHREIEIMTNLSHPHITSVYEVFENSEKIILVMEYASGGELYDFINEKQGLYEEEARKFFRQIVSAAYYLHMNGIVHRDLKLENIVLDRKGQAMIADFGLSNVYNKDEMLNTYCGSPLYASPEIVNGLPYTGPEVDCWSLGVLLFTLVYGAMPFDGSDFRQLRNQITSGHYYEPDKASEAAGLIRFMLTPNPAKRATVRDICDHWWTNFGYDCTPDEETRPGKPVNLVALEKSLSASHSSSDATEDFVKNKPIKGILKKSKNKKEYKQCLDVMNKGTYTTETDLSDGVDKCILLSEDKMTTSHDMNSLNGDQSAFTLTSSKTKANYSKEPEKKGILKKSQDYSNKHPGSGYINEKVGEVVDKHTLTLMLDCTVVDHCTTSGIIKENVEEPCDDGSFWKVGEDGDHIGDVESTLYIDELHLFDYEQPIENSHSGSASASKLCGSPGDQEIQANYQNVAGTGEKLPETELKRIKLAETPISDQSFFQNARNTARELFDSIRSSAPAQSIRGILKGNTHFSNGGDPSWRNTLGSSGSSSSGDLLEFSYDSWEGDTGLSGEKKVRPAYSLPPQNLTKSEDPSLLKQLADQCLSTAQRVDVEEEYVPSPPLPNSVPPSLDTLGGSSDNIDTNHEPGEICFDKSDYEPGEIILSDENGTSKICFGFNSEETINRILRDDYDPSEKEKRADGSQSIQSS